MSYSISYRREVRYIDHPDTFYGRLYFCFEEVGDNNVTECTGKHPRLERRARDWVCLEAAEEHRCFERIAERSAACPGGNLKFAGSSRYATPEGYIKSWRLAFKQTLPLLEQPTLVEGKAYHMDNPADKKEWKAYHRWREMHFSVTAFTRIMDGTEISEITLDSLAKQKLVTPVDGEDQFTHKRYRQWNWDLRDPVQARLWIDTRQGSRGWQYCEVSGPR